MCQLQCELPHTHYLYSSLINDISHKKLIAVTISTPRGPPVPGNKIPQSQEELKIDVTLALQSHCRPHCRSPPLSGPCSPWGDLAEPQSFHSENARGLEGACFPGPAGDLVLHLPSPSCCWSIDTSPSPATDPKLGLVPHPRGDDEDHRAHRHQEWQPAADAEGLPHGPGTTHCPQELAAGRGPEGDRHTLRSVPSPQTPAPSPKTTPPWAFSGRSGGRTPGC